MLLVFVLFAWQLFPGYAVPKLLMGLIVLASRNFAYQLLLSLALVVAACALFQLRKRRLGLYAVIELGVAAQTIWNAVTNVADPTSAMLAVITGVYVLVRGLDNLSTVVAARVERETNGMER
jgi:hypothetical protein